MIQKLKGKQVKDYLFGESLVVFETGSEVAKATKLPNMPLTVYGIPISQIDSQTISLYNEQIAANANNVYPLYHESVRSSNYFYMIFEQLVRPGVMGIPTQSIQKFVHQLQKLLFTVSGKLTPEEIFMKANKSGELCIIRPYSKNMQKTSNLYSKYHNKAILAELLCTAIPIIDKNKTYQTFIQNCESNNLFEKLIPYLNIKMPTTKPQLTKPPSAPKDKKNMNILNSQIKIQGKTSNPQLNPAANKQNQSTKPKMSNTIKSNANQLIKEAEIEYPEIDDKEYQQFLSYVPVNPNLKKGAEEAYRQSIKMKKDDVDNESNDIRQSTKTKKDDAEKQITEIINEVSHSVFNVPTLKSHANKSKVEVKINAKKKKNEADNYFQLHFQMYYSTFTLLKLTIKSYLQKYRKGFAGIVAAHLLTLIGILRKLQLYRELQMGIDVFNTGQQQQTINFPKYMNIIRKDLPKQVRRLVHLKNILQHVIMPVQTYQTLQPYLNQDLQQIDLNKTQIFCFYYMTALMKKQKQFIYHDILVIQVMYVLINPINSLVYSQDEIPKQWNKQYFQFRKLLISGQIPEWKI